MSSVQLSVTVLGLEPEPGETSPYSMAMEAARTQAAQSVMVHAMETALEEGDARAQYAVATWFLFGEYGYPKDPKRAVPMLREAAAGGVREAMFDLAVCFDTGNGVTEDSSQAYLWYVRAALRGDEEAVGLVANYTMCGRGIQANDDLALVWYELAESLGVDVDDAQSFRKFMQDRQREA